MKKILNEAGVVTGLLSKVELEAMKDAYENGGSCFSFLNDGWNTVIPRWNGNTAYKVEYEEKEMIPWEISDFEVGMKLYTENWQTMIISIAHGSFALGGNCYNIGLKEILRRFTKKDGSKFEKEAK